MKYKPIYWWLMTPFIKAYLKKHFSKPEVRAMAQKAKREYKSMLGRADNIGEKNPMASNLYGALLFMSFFTANPDKISKNMLEDMMAWVLQHPVLLSLTACNFNKDWVMALMNWRMRKSAAWAQAHKDEYPESWEFHFYDEPRPGCAYYFTKCPIAKFFRDQGLEDYTHLFCQLDYINIEARHGKLVRKHTLARGDDRCDFWILGDEYEEEETLH